MEIDHSIVGRTPGSESAAALVRRLRARDIPARTGSPDAVSNADIVCTCTTSQTPLFDPALLRRGAHVNAVGAYRLDMCELDPRTFGSALVVVEEAKAALAEAGDIVRAIDAGVLPPEGFAHELRALLSGAVARPGERTTTIFKSVGLSTEDLVLASSLSRIAAAGR